MAPDVVVIDTKQGKDLDATGDDRARLSGTVSELGSGSLPPNVQPIADRLGFAAATTHWLRLTGADTEWVVLVKGASANFAVAKGTAVSASYFRLFGGFSPTRTDFELRVGDTLAYYFGHDGRPDNLMLPTDVSATQGQPLCHSDTECGGFSQYALDVQIGAQRGSLDTYETKRIGAYDVSHLGTSEQDSSSTQCADWFVADTTLVLEHHGQLTSPLAGDCKASATSTLPGVHIELDDSVCTFTLAQASQGLTFHYRLVVDQDVPHVTADRFMTNCSGLGPSGLYLGERIYGGAQSYCLCDQGLCAPDAVGPHTLPQGSYSGTFAWDGRNWAGPSDTGNPEGAPFPAGSYSFEVTATGSSAAGHFEVRGALGFTLQ
jgi:hypothetical protein